MLPKRRSIFGLVDAAPAAGGARNAQRRGRQRPLRVAKRAEFFERVGGRKDRRNEDLIGR